MVAEKVYFQDVFVEEFSSQLGEIKQGKADIVTATTPFMRVVWWISFFLKNVYWCLLQVLELQISQKDVEYPGNDERTKHIGRNCQTKLPCSPSHRESQVWHGETSVSTGVHPFFCFQVNKTGDILESPTPHCRFFCSPSALCQHTFLDIQNNHPPKTTLFQIGGVSQFNQV